MRTNEDEFDASRFPDIVVIAKKAQVCKTLEVMSEMKNMTKYIDL